MCRLLTPEQFLRWIAFAELEPFGDVRADYRAALQAKTAWDIARDVKKHPKPFKLEDFLLARMFDPAPRPAEKAQPLTQTWEQQRDFMKAMSDQFNALKSPYKAA